MFDVEKIYNTGKEANKLTVQRLPVFFGNANTISTDIDIKNEELLHSLKSPFRTSGEDNPKLGFINRELTPSLSVKHDFPRTESQEHWKKYDFMSNTRITLTSDSPLSETSSQQPSSNEVCETGLENLGLVKSILGPSFEDTMLRTLEFGKALIDKKSYLEGDNRGSQCQKRKTHREKRKVKSYAKSSMEGEKAEKRSGRRELRDQRSNRRRIAQIQKNDKDLIPVKKVVDEPLNALRPLNLAKIRSLDSELKQHASSPEKIKRQLEALIQINKDEPPECSPTWGYFYPKDYRPLKTNLEFTVMPASVKQPCCSDNKDGNCLCGDRCTATGACCGGHLESSANKKEECDDLADKSDERSTKSAPVVGLYPASEYISNVLGPTLDLSIMDNLELMRTLFKCDRGKSTENGGEPDEKGEPQGSTKDSEKESKKKVVSEENKEKAEYLQRIEELKSIIQTLEDKRTQLLKEIADAECERDAMRAQIEQLQEEKNTEKTKTVEESNINKAKDEEVKEIKEIKKKRDSLKRNKSLLDAWDVFASKACHTKLPSFSKVQCLERRSMKPNKESHCCFPQAYGDQSDDEEQSNTVPNSRNGRSRSLDSKRPCRGDADLVPYPLQRDVICGMHRFIKTCLCNEPLSKENASWSSDDELRRSAKKSCKKGMPMRSRSETGRKVQNTKLCKVLWAVTRINIFQDNSRTYEVMDATSVPPKFPPVKTEGVFVVKNPKKCCPEPKKETC